MNIVDLITKISHNVWNDYTIGLLLGTGLLLTLLTRFIQIRKFKEGWRWVMKGAMRTDKSDKELGDISPFQALTTALAATVGNGNIAGVATAIFTGGPGAIFWMWITAIFGMATKYAEAVLAVKFRKVAEDGSMAGGPMYYIEQGFKWKTIGKVLALTFAFFGAFTALFGTGNMMQSQSMALAFYTQFGIQYWITGGIVTLFVGLVIIGGIKRIGAVAEKLVPAMIIIYISASILILILNITQIPAAFALIITHAFTPQSAIGGIAGHSVREALRYGVRRGVLSNEAGLGSAPIAHGAAKTNDPIRQGLIGMLGTFIDTLTVCTMTALVIIITGQWSSGLDSTALTTAAFNAGLFGIGGYLIPFASLLFGFSTLLGWSYYGEQCLEYIFGLKIVKGYRIAFVLMCLAGSLLQGEQLSLVWNIGDIANATMAVPNLIGLIGLSGIVMKITKEYLKK